MYFKDQDLLKTCKKWFFRDHLQIDRFCFEETSFNLIRGRGKQGGGKGVELKINDR